MALTNSIKQIFTYLFILCVSFGYLQAEDNPCDLEITYGMNGFVLDWDCDYQAPYKRILIPIESVTGGSGNYTVTALGSQDEVSETSIVAGEGFNYYYSTLEQTNNNIGFIISDGQGSVCLMDETLSIQLYFIDMETLCVNDCTSDIVIETEPGSAVGDFSCSTNALGQNQFTVTVNSVTGGSGSYIVNSLGAGEVSEFMIPSPGGFTYSFTQSDLDNNFDVGFSIEDNNGCMYVSNYEPFQEIYPGININDYCSGGCIIDAEIATFAGTDDIIFNCDLNGPEVVATITIEGITGGTGVYNFSSNVGTIVPVSNSSPGSFIYRYTQGDQDTGQLGIIITDAGNTSCTSTIDLNQLITTPIVEVCNICNYFLNLVENPTTGEPAVSCSGGNVTISALVTSSLNLPINISSLVGSLSASTVAINQAFDYTFNQDDYDSGQLFINVGNEFSNCLTVDIASVIPSSEISDCIVIGIDDYADVEIAIAPNPASNNFQINSTEQINGLALYNAGGQLVSHLDHKMSSFNISHLNAGLYLLQIETNGKIFSEKLLINK